MGVGSLFRILVIILLLLFVSGCGLLNNTPLEGVGNAIDVPLKAITGKAEHPEQVLQSFISDLQNKRYDRAASYFSNQVKQNYTQENMIYLPGGDGDMVVTKVEVSGKLALQAQVYYHFKDSIDQLAYMSKEKGSWKVDRFGPNDNY